MKNNLKEVFQSDFKANLVQNTYNLGYDDFYQVEFDEKRENERLDYINI